MEHQAYEELLTLQALGALDAPDQRQLEEHLGTCAACRGELAELQEAAGLLAHASTPAEPSPLVRERILAAARAERPAVRPRSNVVPFVPPRMGALPQFLRIAAVIAVTAILFVFAILWLNARREINTLRADIKGQQEQLDREREARRRDREALALLSSADTKKMELAGTQVAQNARATFVYDQKSGRAMIMTNGLPAAPAGMAYEVWFIPKGQAPMPGKVFKVDPAGHAMMMDQMPSAAMESAVIAVTLEPEKGSVSPTGAIYLSSPAT